MKQKLLHFATILVFFTSYAQSFMYGDRVTNYTDTLSERYDIYYSLKDSTNRLFVNATRYGDIVCNFSMQESYILYNSSKRKLILNDGLLSSNSILLFHLLDSIYKMPDHPKCSYYYIQLSGAALISKVIAHNKKYLILLGTFSSRWHTYKNIYIIDCSRKKLKLLKKIAFRTLNNVSKPIGTICFKTDYIHRKLYIDSLQNSIENGIVVEKDIKNKYYLSSGKEIEGNGISDFTIFVDKSNFANKINDEIILQNKAKRKIYEIPF